MSGSVESVRGRLELASRIPPGGVGAEIGVWRGEHACYLMVAAKPTKMTLVDPWEPWDREPQWDDYSEFVRHLFRDLPVEIVKSRGVDWLASRPTDSLDWVYLDGSHLECDTRAELDECRRVVKVGGLVCGHDFTVDPFSPWVDGVVRPVLDAIQDGWMRIEVVDRERFTGWLARRVR